MKNTLKFVLSVLISIWAGIGGYWFLTKTTWFEDQFGFIPETEHLIIAVLAIFFLTYWLFHNVCLIDQPQDSSKTNSSSAQKVANPAVIMSSQVHTEQKKDVEEVDIDTEDEDEEDRVLADKSYFTFANIAGYEQTKQSMRFLVSCLADPKKLDGIGAHIPSGILLYGPPGTGKTLLGRAVAGEAGVPFYYMSGSAFVEKYVGVGAKRVRSLFAEAKKHQPCVVFIDELDAVGTRRSDSTNDERQQTLNQLLVEISNLSAEHAKVILIAATNKADSLDPALLRPGRFDRKIAVPLPNRSDRLAILALAGKGKKIDKAVNFDKLSMMTEGMSGADLTALMNEAAIQAVCRDHNRIMQQDIDSALFRMLTGGEQEEASDPKDLRVIAYHEAGHALITKLLTHDEISKVSIIGSTSGALGFTMRYSNKDGALISKKEMEQKLMVLYAGRAAEQCYFGNSDDITTGASDDLKQASILIKEYLTTYGMGKDSVLNMNVFNGVSNGSVTREAQELAHRLYQETVSCLTEHRDLLDRIADALVKKKVLDTEELDQIIGDRKEERSDMHVFRS